MCRQDKKLMMMSLNSADEGSRLCVPHDIRLSSLQYGFIGESSRQVNQINQGISSPPQVCWVQRTTELFFFSTSSRVVGTSVRHLHVRISHVSTHVSIDFDGRIKTSISNILGQELSPLLDCRLLPYSRSMRSQMCCSHTGSPFFLLASRGGRSTRGGVHRLGDSHIEWHGDIDRVEISPHRWVLCWSSHVKACCGRKFRT